MHFTTLIAAASLTLLSPLAAAVPFSEKDKFSLGIDGTPTDQPSHQNHPRPTDIAETLLSKLKNPEAQSEITTALVPSLAPLIAGSTAIPSLTPGIDNSLPLSIPFKTAQAASVTVVAKGTTVALTTMSALRSSTLVTATPVQTTPVPGTVQTTPVPGTVLG